jgi:phage shock protein PspC (stress-responsive transcriptional regulator)
MSKRKFERDPDDRIIAGVCGGLARYFGIKPRLVRVLFFLSMFFGLLGFWIYLLFWLIAPQRRSVRENLSRELRKQVRKLDRLAAEAHDRFSLPGLAGRLADTQELIETLLPDFEKRTLEHTPALRPVYEATLTHLPELLDNYLRLPSQLSKSAEEQLDGELQQLEDTLHRVMGERYGQQFAQTSEALDGLQARYADDPTAPFKKKLEALQARAQGRLDGEALAKIETIKTSLLAALSRLLETANETDQNLYNVRQIALEYLPDTVDKYLALPPGMAEAELSQGKTAKTLLHEQLDVLDTTLNRMVKGLYQDDAQELLIQGHFLRDKFLTQQEWLG